MSLSSSTLLTLFAKALNLPGFFWKVVEDFSISKNSAWQSCSNDCKALTESLSFVMNIEVL